MFNAIKQAFLDCMNTSTGHGLPQMAKPDNLFSRLLWTVFFFVAFAGGFFMIYQSMEEYLQYGVITTTKIKRETQMTMPAVTLCTDETSSRNIHDIFLNCYFNKAMTDEINECKMTDLKLYRFLVYRFENFIGFQPSC